MDIRPSADLRNKYAEISAQCKASREPVFITVNGRGDTVIMDIAQYAVMSRELQLLRELAQSEADINGGKVAPAEQMFAELRDMLGALKSNG